MGLCAFDTETRDSPPVETNYTLENVVCQNKIDLRISGLHVCDMESVLGDMVVVLRTQNRYSVSTIQNDEDFINSL